MALLLASWFSAQLALAQNIPNSIRMADPADPLRSKIVVFATPYAAKLKTQTSEKTARDWFVNQTAIGTPTASFLNVYSGVVNELLLPLAADKDMRVRLNVAVVNAEVARRAGSIAQSELTSALMNDKTDPVALWGLKAAKYLIPAQLLAQPVLRRPDLLPAVVTVLKAHANSSGEGPLVEESYWALTLDPTDNLRNAQLPAIKEALPEVLRLLEYRISQYANGATPPLPLAENLATLFLTRSKVWQVQTPQQQARTMKDIHSLLVGIQSIWGTLPGPAKNELADLVRQTGRAFQVMSDFKASAPLKKAAQAVAEVSADTDAGELQVRLDALKDAIEAAVGPVSP